MASSLWVGVSTLWVSTFLYGIYLVLFCRCMYIFYKGKNQIILLLAAIIMFTLSTVTIIISLLQGASAYGTLGLNLPQLQTAGAIVYVTNNIFADLLLIYRCYVIWNTIWITVVPSLLVIATMILGYSIQLKLFFILSLTTNLLVPTLVAGRLWWIIRRIRGPSGAATRRKGRNAMVIILESGLIYSAVVSIHMVYFHYSNPTDEVIFGALGQIVGIVPTLIIVRVGLGVSQNRSADTTMVGTGGMGKMEIGDSSLSFPVQFQNTIVIADGTTTAEPKSPRSGWDSETIV
ncbi:Zn(2)-C6 fungal-type domain-containing protein [Mycena sanguinolenta]|uniref:Zn(2)-C6 fungal-type domain-containing protein n=1 Tax=Mycena sanguinolenta TaxID=230812 RepID=A0A8H6ZH21_9AGAR|nr:Zn(2)-C6 fungal-type domain-containing protein [Mycena sanguinolenta]